MKKSITIFVILYLIILASGAWWNFGKDDDSAIPRIDIGKDEYLFNLTESFTCSNIYDCVLWSNDSFSHNAFPDFNWAYHVNTTDRLRWNAVNASENVTFDYVDASGFIGDGSQLTNVDISLTISSKAGENINKGECVYISGSVGQTAQVNLCNNSHVNMFKAIGLSAETKSTGQTMLVRIHGLITDIDTSMWDENDTLYVYNNGSLVNVYPTSGVVIEIANVIYSHASQGKLLVHVTSPKNYQSTYSGGDIDLRMGDSVGATCVEFENYTDGNVAVVCSDGSSWFALYVNTTAFYQNDEPMFDYSDVIGISNTTAKWGYSGNIPYSNTSFTDQLLFENSSVIFPSIDVALINNSGAIYVYPYSYYNRGIAFSTYIDFENEKETSLIYILGAQTRLIFESISPAAKTNIVVRGNDETSYGAFTAFYSQANPLYDSNYVTLYKSSVNSYIVDNDADIVMFGQGQTVRGIAIGDVSSIAYVHPVVASTTDLGNASLPFRNIYYSGSLTDTNPTFSKQEIIELTNKTPLTLIKELKHNSDGHLNMNTTPNFLKPCIEYKQEREDYSYIISTFTGNETVIDYTITVTNVTNHTYNVTHYKEIEIYGNTTYYNTTQKQDVELCKKFGNGLKIDEYSNLVALGMQDQQLQIENLQNESLVLHNMLNFFYDEINSRITNVYDELIERLSIIEK